jgi:hypothetical protein
MGPRPSLRAPWAIAVLLCGALAGCGSSSGGNGIASKSPAQIVAAARSAALSASAVHVSGRIVSGGSPITLDMDLIAPRGGRGRLTDNGLGFELIQIGGSVYIKGSAAFYTHIAGPTAAQLLQGRWLKAPTSSGEFSSIASLTDLNKLLSADLPKTQGLSKGKTTKIHGTPAIAITDATKGETVYVATTGRSYPLQLEKTGKGGGRISLDRWNERVTLSAPPDSIDITRLRRGR